MTIKLWQLYSVVVLKVRFKKYFLHLKIKTKFNLKFTAQPQFKTFIRKLLVRNPDGTTKVISETVTQPINNNAAPSTPKQQTDQPQKIQVMRTPDGKMSVRGLQPNQKLVQTSDGKYLILPTNSNGKWKRLNKRLKK